MPGPKRAPGKLAARVKQVKSFSNEMKEKAKKEARDFTMSYRDAASGSKLDRGYKKSARVARRLTKKAEKGKVGEFAGETVDFTKRRKAISTISQNLNTSATGKRRKEVATNYYKALKTRAKMEANPKYAARINENKRYGAAKANPISVTSSGQLSARQRQMVCPQTGTGGASGTLTCNPGGKKSMGKKR